jgi:putative transposase
VDTVLLRRLHVLVFIEHGTRRMHLGGVPSSPTGEWTVQQARNLAFTLDERFQDIKFLIRDRGSNFTASFDAVFQPAGTTIPRCAVQAPRMNATCERLAGTLRREFLDRVLILGEAHLRGRGRVPGALGHRPAAPGHRPARLRRRTRRSSRHPDPRQHTSDPPKPVPGGLIHEYTHAARRPEDPQVTCRILFSSGTGSAPSLTRVLATRSVAGRCLLGRRVGACGLLLEDADGFLN